MKSRVFAFVLLLSLATLTTAPARACGFGEAPGDCGGSSEGEAKYMLQRVVKAIQADKPKALATFVNGEDGFRTVDTYVFCVGPDGIMSAHPSAKLQGQDVHDLHDKTGNYFIAEMMKQAKPGSISQIRYLFPRPGGTEAVAKTTYYTRAEDQVCGVGIYDGDEATAAAVTVQAHLAQLRQRLNAGMPTTLNADWTAFLQTLDEENAAKTAAFTKVREQVHAAEAVLATEESASGR